MIIATTALESALNATALSELNQLMIEIDGQI
jgi:hypothetical protein